MKKGQIIEGMVECVEFPNKGIVRTEDGGRVIVKNAVPGQKVSASINKVRRGKCEGRLLEVLERSAKEQPEAACIHAGECGGCTYQTLPYEEQLAMKASQVKKLIDDVIVPENTGIRWSFHSVMRTREDRWHSACTSEAAFMTSWMSRNAGL